MRYGPQKDQHTVYTSQKIFGNKLKEWKYEQEVRIISWRKERALRLDPGHVKEIIFGAGMDRKEMRELSQMARDQYPSAALKVAVANRSEGGLAVTDLADDLFHPVELPKKLWKSIDPMHTGTQTGFFATSLWPSDPEVLIFARKSKYLVMASNLERDQLIKQISNHFPNISEMRQTDSATSFKLDWGYLRCVEIGESNVEQLGITQGYWGMLGFSKPHRFVFSIFPFGHNASGLVTQMGYLCSVMEELALLDRSGEFALGNALHKHSSTRVLQHLQDSNLFGIAITMIRHLDKRGNVIPNRYYSEGFGNFGCEEFVIRCDEKLGELMIDLFEEIFEMVLQGVKIDDLPFLETRTFGEIKLSRVFSTTYRRKINSIKISKNFEGSPTGADYGFAVSYRFQEGLRSEPVDILMKKGASSTE